MQTKSKIAVLSVALSVVVWAPATSLAQSNLRDRLGSAIETIKSTCAADAKKFCGNVTDAEGRILLCMQAHDDQLSGQCQLALYRVSRNLEHAASRVERVADACWSDIESTCAGAEKIGRCVIENRATLSSACQTAVSGIRQVLQGLVSLTGMPVYSADEKNLGNVVEVRRAADGNVQSVQIEVGRFLGVGGRIVTIDANALEQLGDRIQLRLTSEAIRSLPEVKR